MPEKEVELPFKSPVFQSVWSEWLQFRKESRFKNYVPTGLKRTFTQLVKDSGNDEQTAIAIIEQSISNGWRGLFALKQNYVTGSTNNTGRKLSKHEAGITGTLKDLEEYINTGGV